MTRRRGAPPHERACRLGAGCRCARPPPGSPLRSDPAPRGAGGDLDPVSAHRRGAITGSRPRPATQLARHDHDENRPGRLHLSKARFWSERWGPPHDSLLQELFNAEDCALTRWVSQFLFLGPVHRAYTPGAKLDEMPVLVGPQGIGKSALLLNLFPSENAGWVNDGLHLSADPKVRAEALLGRVVVEASEMAGSTRADLESLKSFISRQNDGGIRLAFRRNPEDAPRRCIVVGTSNRHDSLPNDPSGNRRFIPVVLHAPSQAVEEYMALHRDLLWSEAIYRHSLSVSPRLPRSLMPQATEAAESHRNRDTVIEDALAKLPADWEGTLAETAQKIGLLSLTDAGVKLPMREQKRLSAALTGLGWVMRQVKQEGIKSRVWKRDAVPGTA